MPDPVKNRMCPRKGCGAEFPETDLEETGGRCPKCNYPVRLDESMREVEKNRAEERAEEEKAAREKQKKEQKKKQIIPGVI